MLSQSIILISTLAKIVLAVGHQVAVGLGGLVYSPSTVQAAIGDTVSFNFHPLDHSVTQSSFAAPCQPLAAGGFDSGFVPSAAGATSIPSYVLTITNASVPIWFYCAQGSHCEAGMVGAINPPTSGNTFEKFQAAAKVAAKATASISLATGGVNAHQTGSISNVPNSAVQSSSAASAASVAPSAAAPSAGSSSLTSTDASPYGSGTYGTPAPAPAASSTTSAKSSSTVLSASLMLVLVGMSSVLLL